MLEKNKKELIKTITFIPGVVGLAPIDFSLKPRFLSKEKYNLGIKCEPIGKKHDISIAVIVDKNINARTISKEISTSMNKVLKSADIIINDIKIYIRGVK